MATYAGRRHHAPRSIAAVTTAILNHVRLGRLPKAVSTLFSSDNPFPFSLYAYLFRLCIQNRALVETRKLESHLVAFNPRPPTFLLNRAIEAYGRCGCFRDAKGLFDEMPQRDGGSWNAIIAACSRNGMEEYGLRLFKEMFGEGILGSEVTYATVLSCCACILDFRAAQMVHDLIVKSGFVGNVILESSLVDVYGKCRSMGDARKVFDCMLFKNEISWNVIVRRYLEADDGREAIRVFREMMRTYTRPMKYTVSNAFLACLNFGGAKEGVQIHGFTVKTNAIGHEVVSTTLIGMYAKFRDMDMARSLFDLPCCKNVISSTTMVGGYAMSGRLTEARELFDSMTERTVISWNVMLAGYTRASEWDKALEFVMLMRVRTKDIDHITLGLILNICSSIPDLELGKQVHGFSYRNGFHSNLVVGNGILDMYGKCGSLNRARTWFNEMSHLRDKVSWNALLTSYARHGLSEEAMTTFWKMLGETKPSKFTFGTLLAACANIFALKLGKQIHGFMIRNLYDMDVVVNGALVDMYSKCRCIAHALNVFNSADSKDAILYNSMILGCSHNGRGGDVVELFEDMEREGIKPDHVTLRGLLHAFINDARVDLGKNYFELMTRKYSVIPRIEHYESMIELLGQNGYVNELEVFISEMPFEPTAAMLARVFDYGRMHRCSRMAKWACDRLNETNSSVPFRYDC